MENQIQQIYELVMSLSDIASRTDEKIKITYETFQDIKDEISVIHNKLEKLSDIQDNAIIRITVLENKNGHVIKKELDEVRQIIHNLEIKINNIEFKTSNQENKWKITGDFLFKVAISIIGTFIAWKLSSH